MFKKLLIAKFTINNNKFSSIKLFLFFVLKSFYLQVSFNIVDFLDITTFKRINKKKTFHICKTVQITQKFFKNL